MNEDKVSSYYDVLPGELTASDIDVSRHFLEILSPAKLLNWAEERTVVSSHNDQRFRMVVDRPINGDENKTVVVLSEFGTNILPRLMAKSILIRNFVNPDATLIIQPSSVVGEPNMNYSVEERHKLYEGDLDPIIGRIVVTLANVGKPSEITMFGHSQGGVIGLGCASNDGFVSISLAAYELPTVVERSFSKLRKDFSSSGDDLVNIIKANFENHNSPFALMAERDASTVLGMAKYSLRALHPDNIATAGALRYDTAFDRIEKALDKGSNIVQAWGDRDNVSPAYANEQIANKFRLHPGYISRPLHGMSHALPDFYALDGALARLASNGRLNNIDS